MADSSKLRQIDALLDTLATLNLTDDSKKCLAADLKKIMDEFIEQEKKDEAKILDEMQRHYDRQAAQVPESILSLTIGQIKAAGGSFTVDSGSFSFEIPTKLIRETSSSINSPMAKLNSPMFLKGMRQITLASSHKNNLMWQTPTSRSTPVSSHPMTRRKVVRPPERFDPSLPENNSSVCNTAVKSSKASASSKSSNSTVKKVRSARAVASATKILAQSRLQSKAKSKATAARSEKNDAIEKCATTEVAGRRISEVNPRTPGGQNRMFSKNPRLPKPDEHIVHASVKGTPLIVK